MDDLMVARAEQPRSSKTMNPKRKKVQYFAILFYSCTQVTTYPQASIFSSDIGQTMVYSWSQKVGSTKLIFETFILDENML